MIQIWETIQEISCGVVRTLVSYALSKPMSHTALSTALSAVLAECWFDAPNSTQRKAMADAVASCVPEYAVNDVLRGIYEFKRQCEHGGEVILPALLESKKIIIALYLSTECFGDGTDDGNIDNFNCKFYPWMKESNSEHKCEICQKKIVEGDAVRPYCCNGAPICHRSCFCWHVLTNATHSCPWCHRKWGQKETILQRQLVEKVFPMV